MSNREHTSFSKIIGDVAPTQYTRPFEFHGITVPEVLISGNHAKIDEWRYNEAKKRTLENRPDVLLKYGGEEIALDKK